MAEMKLWKCKEGHILGEVKWAGHGKSQLYLFRNALSVGAEDEQEVVAVLEGYVTATVRCSRCAGVRMWVPGEEALKRLIDSHLRLVQGGKEDG